MSKNTSPTPKDFLNALHGFRTSKPKCNKKTTFATLVDTGKKAGLIKKHELTVDFNLESTQLGKVKLNQTVGVNSDTRQSILDLLETRAKQKLGLE
jgi:hypothetical protein